MKGRFSNLIIDSNKSITELLEFLIKKALDSRASDLHIDPLKDEIRLRLRVDGSLHELPHLSLTKHQEIISKIKILSGLRIDEHLKSQDGRFRLILEKGFVDVRVSVLPTYYGENAVLRLLSDQNESLNLENLGFAADDLAKIKKAILKPNGMILSTGPTGCGKTTALYAILKTLNKNDVSIITIEEPIEYAIPGIRQIQVNAGSNLNFGSGLRSILRQDPNIIMVGEIRDHETAVIAVNAALTGHLLLSTLHTNDAAATLPRLIQMGIEPFLLASTFSIAINQRLVKKLCDKCKVEEKINAEQKIYLKDFFKKDISRQKFWKGTGCDFCNGTGFFGRTIIGEIMPTDEKIRNLILSKSTAGEIRKSAIKNGMQTLLQDGLKKVKSGITSLGEVLRAAYE